MSNISKWVPHWKLGDPMSKNCQKMKFFISYNNSNIVIVILIKETRKILDNCVICSWYSIY